MLCIESERLIIRMVAPEDAPAIYAYRSDLEANKYQGWFPASEEEVREYILKMPTDLNVPNACYQIAIIRRDDSVLIGDMGIVFTNHDNQQVEIGCTLKKDYQGKGYGTEAMKAVIHFLFVDLNKHRIVVSIDPRNTPSIRMAERLGLTKEGHFRESYYVRGEWTDDVIYAMLQKEWMKDDIIRKR